MMQKHLVATGLEALTGLLNQSGVLENASRQAQTTGRDPTGLQLLCQFNKKFGH